MNTSYKKYLILASIAIAIGLLVWGFCSKVRPTGLGEGCVSGNGRTEAPEIDVATTAVPEEVVRRVKAAGFKAVPTGIEHGTVTVV